MSLKLHWCSTSIKLLQLIQFTKSWRVLRRLTPAASSSDHLHGVVLFHYSPTYLFLIIISAQRLLNAPAESPQVIHSDNSVRNRILDVVNSTWDTGIATGMETLPSIIAVRTSFPDLKPSVIVLSVPLHRLPHRSPPRNYPTCQKYTNSVYLDACNRHYEIEQPQICPLCSGVLHSQWITVPCLRLGFHAATIPGFPYTRLWLPSISAHFCLLPSRSPRNVWPASLRPKSVSCVS